MKTSLDLESPLFEDAYSTIGSASSDSDSSDCPVSYVADMALRFRSCIHILTGNCSPSRVVGSSSP